jgi:sulfite exporter TauE/SafE
MFDIINALILGFTYGLGPCTISCAPLVVPLIMSTANTRKEGIILSIIFSLGRVISYIALGALAGLMGRTLDFYLPQKYLGIFFVILGIAVFFNIHGKCIMKSRFKITSNSMALVTGIIYGAGPCPPLIALLGLAVVSKSAIIGALMGLVFGLGTIVSPLIILGLFSGWFAKHKEFKQVIPYVSGLFLALLGLGYLLFSK